MNESSKRAGPTNESITRIFRLLEVVEQDILPLTRQGVQAGNKIFGAAVLNKTDESLVVAGTNTELENPLWHGEVATIKRLYEMPQSNRPQRPIIEFRWRSGSLKAMIPTRQHNA